MLLLDFGNRREQIIKLCPRIEKYIKLCDWVRVRWCMNEIAQIGGGFHIDQSYPARYWGSSESWDIYMRWVRIASDRRKILVPDKIEFSDLFAEWDGTELRELLANTESEQVEPEPVEPPHELTRDVLFQALQSENNFPIDFDDVWQWLGYSRRSAGIDALKSFGFQPGQDFQVFQDILKNPVSNVGGRPYHKYWLTVSCFKRFCMMSNTERGAQVRLFYLQIEEEWQAMKAASSQQPKIEPTQSTTSPPSSLDILVQNMQGLAQMAQGLTQVAQSLATVERQQSEMRREQERQQQALIDLLLNKAKAEAELSELPKSQNPAAEKTVRAAINEIVRNYVQRTQADHQEVWRKIYKELYYRYHYDVSARVRSSGRKKLDQIEYDEKLNELHAIASELLV